jgi:hypothetical protein
MSHFYANILDVWTALVMTETTTVLQTCDRIPELVVSFECCYFRTLRLVQAEHHSLHFSICYPI